MTFTKAFIAIFCVLFVHAVAIIFHLYGLWHWFDIPMHYSGGLTMGLLGLAIWQQGIAEVKFKGWLAKHLEWWLVPLFLIGFVAFVGIGWEMYEFVMDQWFTEVIDGVYQFLRQPSLADTMLDFAMDLLGGASVAVFVLIKRL
ncbi:MAG: hypothetical protein ABH826_02790 [Patescibacteria group bacterium]